MPQYLSTIEAEYHRHLLELGAQRPRGDRTEFFKADLSMVREAMLKTFKNRSGFNIYEVTANDVREINPPHTSHSAPPMARTPIRRTPRIASQSSQESPQEETLLDESETVVAFEYPEIYRLPFREAARKALYGK